MKKVEQKFIKQEFKFEWNLFWKACVLLPLNFYSAYIYALVLHDKDFSTLEITWFVITAIPCITPFGMMTSMVGWLFWGREWDEQKKRHERKEEWRRCDLERKEENYQRYKDLGLTSDEIEEQVRCHPSVLSLMQQIKEQPGLKDFLYRTICNISWRTGTTHAANNKLVEICFGKNLQWEKDQELDEQGRINQENRFTEGWR
jgi:hypothetical protein